MAADGVAQCFKTTILSSKVRLRKPDPDIYHLACRCIGTPEANCAYVGDNPCGTWRALRLPASV